MKSVFFISFLPGYWTYKANYGSPSTSTGTPQTLERCIQSQFLRQSCNTCSWRVTLNRIFSFYHKQHCVRSVVFSIREMQKICSLVAGVQGRDSQNLASTKIEVIVTLLKFIEKTRKCIALGLRRSTSIFLQQSDARRL